MTCFVEVEFPWLFSYLSDAQVPRGFDSLCEQEENGLVINNFDDAASCDFCEGENSRV